MLILTIRTDKPEAELGLFDGDKKLAYETWQAHRELSDTVHKKMDALLKSQNRELEDLQAIICFKGPGSFTGLRIGLTVGNALAYSLDIPVVSTMGENWIAAGTERLRNGENEKIALPEYGAEANITVQKK
jgi:tRNA threonylcarbamoyladenosine biosynthesis protein TsaB